MTLQEQLQAAEDKLSLLQAEYDNAVIEKEYCKQKLRELDKITAELGGQYRGYCGHIKYQKNVIAAIKSDLKDQNADNFGAV